jgi:hypothetical protein
VLEQGLRTQASIPLTEVKVTNLERMVFWAMRPFAEIFVDGAVQHTTDAVGDAQSRVAREHRTVSPLVLANSAVPDFRLARFLRRPILRSKSIAGDASTGRNSIS